MKVRIHRICKDNPLPSQANPGDAGWDCYAAEDVDFVENEIRLVPLGIIAEAPKGYYFQLCLRSSMAAKRGFTLGNGVGVIDCGFAGEKDEIKAILKAPNKYSEIKKGERVCQLILKKINDIEWDEQEDRNFKGKSRLGFGSSGL